MINLPKDFEDRMQGMLGSAYPAFVRSYEKEKMQALRVNALKTSVEEFLEKAPFFDRENALRVPWEKNGFYYAHGRTDELIASQYAPGATSREINSPYSIKNEAMQPGKHPFHDAGVYYIQEPSAMMPVPYLEAKPGEKLLDLCAAPGGKSAQIASYMNNEGFLMCNEMHPARAKILSENVERMGIKNALVTNETPQHLSELFGGCFDKILVDAPCSGEGMFRKNEEARSEWSLENVKLCAKRQDMILDCADIMLRPGGRIVYSTCTFAPEENEGSVVRFIERHPDYEALKTLQLFPHLICGEGHFAAVLQKAGEVPAGYRGFLKNGLQKGIAPRDVKEFILFQEENLKEKLLDDKEERLLRFGEQIYLMPENMPSVKGIKALRPGLHLGTLKKNRFEPSHALALALCRDEAKRSMELCDDDVKAYLGGQTLSCDGEKGWHLMTYCGYSIGWGKLAGQVMKNHYPRGIRKL